jgi:hypothetical protein
MKTLFCHQLAGRVVTLVHVDHILGPGALSIRTGGHLTLDWQSGRIAGTFL